jgi:ADP-ribose pyrophosphatase
MSYPEWVNIIALTSDDQVIMIRQYRHAIKKTILEIPSGLIDKGDSSPLEAAAHELLEETGYQC